MDECVLDLLLLRPGQLRKKNKKETPTHTKAQLHSGIQEFANLFVDNMADCDKPKSAMQ